MLAQCCAMLPIFVTRGVKIRVHMLPTNMDATRKARRSDIPWTSHINEPRPRQRSPKHKSV